MSEWRVEDRISHGRWTHYIREHPDMPHIAIVAGRDYAEQIVADHGAAARLAAAEAERDRLNELAEGRLAHFEHSEESRARHFARAEKAEAERDRLRVALEWYADPEHYNDGRPGELRNLVLWAHDNGERARAALAPVAEGEVA